VNYTVSGKKRPHKQRIMQTSNPGVTSRIFFRTLDAPSTTVGGSIGENNRTLTLTLSLTLTITLYKSIIIIIIIIFIIIIIIIIIIFLTLNLTLNITVSLSYLV